MVWFGSSSWLISFLFLFSSSILQPRQMHPKDLATVVLDHYDKLLANGKPVKDEEFTVMAAFVAKITTKVDENGLESHTQPILKVISMATGTKCVGEVLIDGKGYIIPDSHAEVLARKALVRYLLYSIIALVRDPKLQDKADFPLMKIEERDSLFPFKIKPTWQFYLFVSDNPCGDACIYSTRTGELAFTGAKLSHAHNLNEQAFLNENGLVIEPSDQLLGECRTKSTRSDIAHPTSSMSCSDKICRWRHVGLQGSQYLGLLGRVPLSGVVLGSDPNTTLEHQHSAARRALIDRFDGLSTASDPLFLAVVDDPLFSRSKSVLKHRHQLLDDQKEQPNSLTSDLSAADSKMSDGSVPVVAVDATRVSKRPVDDHPPSDPQPSKKARTAKKAGPLPYGQSINWHLAVPGISDEDFLPQIATKTRAVLGGTQEVTIAHTGLPQGKNIENLVTRNGKICVSRLSPFCQDLLLRLLHRELTGKRAVEDSQTDQPSQATCPEVSEEFLQWRRSLDECTQAKELSKEFFSHRIFRHWIHTKADRQRKSHTAEKSADPEERS